MGKITNVLTMLSLLDNHQKYSISELSKRIEVSPRMIPLYKDELEKAGIYIDTIRGPYGGYVLNQEVLLPTQSFSTYDLKILKNIQNIIKDQLDVRLQKEYSNLIDKIQGLYQGSLKKVRNNNVITTDERHKYNIIAKAIKEKRKLLIYFLQVEGETRERIIHPCHLFLYNNTWYVSAFCELRGEMRHFSLSRIIDYNLLDQKFP